jgi:hypothetical protein
MKSMIKASTGWNISKVLMVAAFALTLTACGGGGSSSVSETVLQQIQRLVASGTAANLEAALDLANNTCENVTASECEAFMDAIAAA